MKKAIIIGAGPAGLTAAYELLNKTKIKPIIYEMSNEIGGISRTVKYKGYRMDIGGHRFYSKSNTVMNWFQSILPVEDVNNLNKDHIMLRRNRKSKILYLGKLFKYPITMDYKTLSLLGFSRVIRIILSYFYSKIFPIKNEISLQDFFINRFGRVLYRTFFKDYTEKVWGITCEKIPAIWGYQRIKKLSILKIILHSFKKIVFKNNSINQNKFETSLIEKFLYPKFGPGQFWEKIAKIIINKGGIILKNHEVIGLKLKNNNVIKIKILNVKTGNIFYEKADYFFSSAPIKDLINYIGENAPESVREIGNGLQYRDFITVGLLVKNINFNKIHNSNNNIEDQWIYVQEKQVKLGRIQIYNNWSPYLIQDKLKYWIGLEYFCNETDDLWKMDDNNFIEYVKTELAKINLIEENDLIDNHIVRVKKAYPAYFGKYNEFQKIKNFTNRIENLFLIGRNGMHQYNNMDHSILSSIEAVNNIIDNIKTKNNIWNVNTENVYN